MNTVSASPRLNLFWFSSPQTFFPLAGRMIPLFSALALALGLVGLYIACTPTWRGAWAWKTRK